MQEPTLTDHHLADLASGRDTFDRETLEHLRRFVFSDPRVAPQVARLEQEAREMGLDPATTPDALELAVQYLQDFEALLAAEGWDDPLEVLDPEGLGPDSRHVGYEEMQRLAVARAERVAAPERLLAVKEKIGRAQSRLEGCRKHRDDFLQSLGEFEAGVAEEMLGATASRFRREQARKAEQGLQPENTAAAIERQLDQLVVASGWSHPVQVLPAPRGEFSALLRACRLRMQTAEGEELAQLEGVEAKLEEAVCLADSARRRRQEMRRRVS